MPDVQDEEQPEERRGTGKQSEPEQAVNDPLTRSDVEAPRVPFGGGSQLEDQDGEQ